MPMNEINLWGNVEPKTLFARLLDHTGMAVLSADDTEAMLGILFPDRNGQNTSVIDKPCYVSLGNEDIKKKFSVGKLINDSKNFSSKTGGRSSSSKSAEKSKKGGRLCNC